MRKKRRTLCRHYRRDPVDTRDNQKVSPRSFSFSLASNKRPNPRFDYLATKTHAIIVPSCGVDSIPADATVHLASKALGHVALRSSLCSASLRGGAPGGTLATFFTTFEDVPRAHLRNASRDWALSPILGAPSPPCRLVYRLGGGHIGGTSVFGPVNRAIIQRTAGLHELRRRERRAGGRNASYGPAFTYTEFTPTGNVVTAYSLSLAIGAILLSLLLFPPVECLFRFSLTHCLFCLFLFTARVGAQASGDATRLRAGRQVRVDSTFFSHAGGN